MKKTVRSKGSKQRFDDEDLDEVFADEEGPRSSRASATETDDEEDDSKRRKRRRAQAAKRKASRQEDDQEAARKPRPEKVKKTSRRDRVREALEESFPASDPPSYTPGHS